jgi:CRP-like cAMP-binding protein
VRRPTADELRKLKDKAAEAAAKGKLDKAADLYAEVAEGDPKDIGTRHKLAEVLRRAGRIPQAIQAYREVADRFGKDGLLIKAIAISKTILELDPEHVETQSALAELYAKKAAAEGARPPPRTMMMQAMKAAGIGPGAPPQPIAKPKPPPPPDDGMVAIPLAPPAAEEEAIPLEILLEPEPEVAPVAAPPPVPRPAPRAQAGFEAPAVPSLRRPSPIDEPETAYAQIVFAAEEAVEAGIDEDILIESDPIDVEVTGDEPLAFESTDAARGDASVAADPLEVLEPEPELMVEPEPEIAAEPPRPAAPPARPAPASPPAKAPLPARPAPGPGRAPPAPTRPPPPPRTDLPHVPIFSDLSREAFLALTQGMVLHRISEGDSVIRERDEGTSFYVIASGRFAVSKRQDAGDSVVLARLGEGDFFGEMALLSGAPRSATVTAEEDAEVLEFRADVLLQLARQHPHVAQSLRRFYRQRLLANALAVSPIFRPFQRGDRKLLIERFRAREVAEGETVIREGEPSDGLYVVLEGAVDVIKHKDGQDLVVGQLREGDLFGEMSCLRKAPASASVMVSRPGTLLRLPRREFDEMVVSYPQILELVSTLSEERAENLDAILSGHAQWTDDGLVLT